MEDSLLLNRQGKAKGKVPLGARASIVSKSGNAYLCSALRSLGQRLTFLSGKVLLASGMSLFIVPQC